MPFVPLKKWKTKLIIPSARHVNNSAQSHGSGAKIEESYFTGLESKLFFTGGKPKLAQI